MTPREYTWDTLTWLSKILVIIGAIIVIMWALPLLLLIIPWLVSIALIEELTSFFKRLITGDYDGK